MKKVLFASLLSIGLLATLPNMEVSAAENEPKPEETVGIQNSVQTSMSPLNLRGDHQVWYTIRVGTNVSGVNHFEFNPGTGVKPLARYDTSTSDFRFRWSSSSLVTYNTSARVISEEYGPGPRIYGTARIVYR
ncbi:hypothetical protein [Alkalihalobacillus pseudalcaliphilus]|uniref:hypothetical protein n=1 Tax=Alkalihalobacillus pseudalcaliphilus TaxID=79884 RepID=UPI00064E047F|nr:hypothetical protein [Alkalihalobacillus pseudalcaliphilus]KMK74350.1 hypothetical protein AB990_20755 [Alkalihalobacillus pseudalcaliphilus]